jgi:hypothetical protein
MVYYYNTVVVVVMNEKSKLIPRGKNPHLHQSESVACGKIGEGKRSKQR